MQDVDSESDRYGFNWPEAIVFDVISEQYAAIKDRYERNVLTRLHAGLLADAFDGYDTALALRRKALINHCNFREISLEVIFIVENKILEELQSVVAMKYRCCDRKKRTISIKLDRAFNKIDLIQTQAAQSAA